MSVSNKLTGKAGSFTYSGTSIPFNKVSISTTRGLVDATDSTDYDSGDDIVYKSQLAATLELSVKIEGRYNTSVIPSTVIADLYTGNAAVACRFTQKTSVIYGSGSFDVADFECSAPLDDITTYSCTLKLNGKFTRGS